MITVISCVFGKQFKTLYQAPRCPEVSEALLFSNNPDLREIATLKGWTFQEVPADIAPLTSDYAESSVQSKYVKFLRFLSDRSDLRERLLRNEGDSILYTDHKFRIMPVHVKTAVRRITVHSDHDIQENDKLPVILVRETPVKKESVWDEVKCGMGQPRYAVAMKQTEDFIRRTLAEHSTSVKEDVRVCNTGVLLYVFRGGETGRQDLLRFLNDMYDTCRNLHQPECQIIWCLLSQLHARTVKFLRIGWLDLNPVWRLPT